MSIFIDDYRETFYCSQRKIYIHQRSTQKNREKVFAKKKKKIFSVEGEYKMWELHVAHSFVSFSHKILVLKLQITTTTRARNVNDVKSLPFTFPLIRKRARFPKLMTLSFIYGQKLNFHTLNMYVHSSGSKQVCRPRSKEILL